MKPYFGFSLIELMVSLFIFTLMLLIILDMQTLATQVTRNGRYIAVATRQLDSLAQHLLAYEDPLQVLEEWNKVNKQVLPNGRGEKRGSVWTLYWGNISQCKKTTLGVSGCLLMTLEDQA